MRRSFLCIAILVLLPVGAQARIYDAWRMDSEAVVDLWYSSQISGVVFQEDGVTLGIKEQGVLYRPLPEGFHENVDALRLEIGGFELDKVVLQFIETAADGTIARTFRLRVNLTGPGLRMVYIPLTFYRSSIAGMDTLALSFHGESDAVPFAGIEFLKYGLIEKTIGSWRSFWSLYTFDPSTINFIIGPTVIPEIGTAADVGNAYSSATSANAYFLVFLSLVGLFLLFAAAWKRGRGDTTPWPIVRHKLLATFFVVITAVWLLYDVRMGAEFFNGVKNDHRDYISASPADRTFRDRGRFYDFAAFAAPLVADREIYEVFLPAQWPYMGNLQYYTYPAIPNADDPVSDTWVIFARPDITISSDNRLVLQGSAFTTPGSVLGYFDDGSFVFRESSS